MSTAILYNDEPILLEDTLPATGDTLPFFTLVSPTLEDVTLDDFQGMRKLLHFFPSIDTPTSAQSVRQFEKLRTTLDNTVILHISADLPFALARFCAQEQLPQPLTLSTLRGRDMVKNYGVLIVTSKLAGLPARAVMVADADNRLRYLEVVHDLSSEPDYSAAMQALRAE